MKNILSLIAILILSFTAIAQTNFTIPNESMRVCRNTALNLTTSWQTIDFNGSCAYNNNSFAFDPATGLRMIYWDSTNKLFKIITNYPNREIVFQMFPETASTGLGLTTAPTTVQYRIVVPNGVSAGVDLYSPYVDSPTAPGYADLNDVHLFPTKKHYPVNLTLQVNQAAMTNGFYVQFRLSNSMVLGSCSLSYCSASARFLK